MSVSICVGEYAQTPYKIAGLDCTVYCIEELCYCLKENTVLLDMSLMNDALLDWIGRCCGLKDLAKELHPLVHKKGSLSSFVVMILDYVGLYDPQVVARIGQSLKQGAGLSGIERKKTIVDNLLKKGKFLAAIEGYDNLLKSWEQMQEQGEELPAGAVRAAILHNKGTALCALMLYERAGEAFREAYDITCRPEDFLPYLATKRVLLSDSEYIDFVAGYPQFYDVTLALEKKWEEIRIGFSKDPRSEKLELRRSLREGRSGLPNDRQRYYEENETLVRVLKNGYRDCVSE